MKSRCNYIQ